MGVLVALDQLKCIEVLVLKAIGIMREYRCSITL